VRIITISSRPSRHTSDHHIESDVVVVRISGDKLLTLLPLHCALESVIGGELHSCGISHTHTHTSTHSHTHSHTHAPIRHLSIAEPTNALSRRQPNLIAACSFRSQYASFRTIRWWAERGCKCSQGQRRSKEPFIHGRSRLSHCASSTNHANNAVIP